MKLCRDPNPNPEKHGPSIIAVKRLCASLARHFYCRDPGHINQPAVGPSTRLLPVPSSPTTTLSHSSAASPPSTSSASEAKRVACVRVRGHKRDGVYARVHDHVFSCRSFVSARGRCSEITPLLPQRVSLRAAVKKRIVLRLH